MTLFGLIRHGRTDYNRRGLFQGSSDIPLDAVGREQAHHALDAFAEQPWDVIVSSPLLRAQETARIIAEDHGIPFGGTDPRLQEIDWGIAEGRPSDEMQQAYPDRDFPGVEDPQAVADRGYDALEDLEQRYPGQRVLIAAHGTIIRFLLSGVAERPLDSIPNGTLSMLSLEGNEWGVRMIAGVEVDHEVRVADRSINPRFRLDKPHELASTAGAGDASSEEREDS